MKEYKDKMDQICWSEEGKENLIRRVASESKNGNTYRRKRAWVKRTVILTIICVLGMSTVLGAGFHKTPWELLGEIFGTKKQQVEVIDAMGVVIGASDRSNGIIMTAEASIADSRNLCIVYSFEREDGKPLLLSAPEGYLLDKLWLENGNQSLDEKYKGISEQAYRYNHANTMIEYEDRIIEQKEGKVIVMRTYTMNSTMPKQMKIEETFESIKCPSATNNHKTATLLKGKWHLKYKVKSLKSSVRLSVQKKLPLKNMDYEIESVDISQLGVNIQGKQIANVDEKQSSVDYPKQIYLELKNGKKIDLCGIYELPVTFLENEKGEKKGMVSANILYDEIIPLDRIKSITIGDEKFPLPACENHK